MVLAPKERKFGGNDARPGACTKTNNFFQGARSNDPDRIPGQTSTIDRILRSGVANFFLHLSRFCINTVQLRKIVAKMLGGVKRRVRSTGPTYALRTFSTSVGFAEVARDITQFQCRAHIIT
ncbi:hypothetical protein [Microcoleus sp. N3A4]|uniref:hypothetical protein n=1 Tax=Microcoleus sp. N3A4 TaxID=3055379 RepID=UPI002FCF42B5